jgi:hypothetical protein
MIDAVCFRWRGRKQLIEPYLRTAVDFLLAYNVLLRSESRLAVEFLDFFTIPLPGEGPTPCFPMIVIMDNDKINPLGRLGYGTVIRYRNLLLCTIGHTAFSFTGGISPARPLLVPAGASSGTVSTLLRANTRRIRWRTTHSSSI